MENNLYHHGVKGMHWGVRRYRNPDGSLTEAGKKRYGRHVKSSYQTRRRMTDEELTDRTRRVRAENELRILEKQNVSSSGKDFASGLMKKSITALVMAGTAYYGKKYLFG